MNLLSIGISHHTAPVDVRETMYVTAEELPRLLARLRESLFAECVVVSTCNRTELYGVLRNPSIADRDVLAALLEARQAPVSVHPGHFVSQHAGAALHHLFKVSAGVDSMVIGDIQILNQVKEAFQTARDAGTLGPVLNRLMQAGLHVGKRVRSETAIGEGAVSVSYAAVELAGKIFADLSRKTALLIGAGETAELTMKHLVGKGIGKVLVANRTRSRAEALVARLGGTVADYEQMVDALQASDIVITSVSSPAYVVQPDDVHTVMRRRGNNPLFIIDIGVPRNVNPAARKIENVFLYDIDALSTIVDRNLQKRIAAIPTVTRIIREEMVEFLRWHKSLEVAPAIQEFRNTLETIRQEEVQKHINRFSAGDRELVELVTRRIVNKILHQPLTALKQGAGNGNSGAETTTRVKVLRELFGMTRGEKHDG